MARRVEQDAAVWRLGLITRGAYAVAVLGFLAVGIGETVVSGWDGLVVLVFAPAFAVLFWRQALVPHLTPTGDAVIVHNPYSRKSLAYSDIADVTVRSAGLPLLIRLRSGATVVPWCIQQSAAFGAGKYRRARLVAEAIRARLP